MTQSFPQLLARVSPGVGHSQPTEWTHQDASRDSKFLIQFQLTLDIYQSPACVLESEWDYSARLGHILYSGSGIEMSTWVFLKLQGNFFFFMQGKETLFLA